MTSALEARPKLKDDVKIVRREHLGLVHYVVKEPSEQKYFQFGETEVALMRLMDGERTPTDIADSAVDSIGIRPDAGQVADFAQKLKRLGLVERTPVEQHLMAMERLRSQRKVRARRKTKGSILRLRFSIGDPDQLFNRMFEWLRWAWTRPFVWSSVALFAIYFIAIIAKWDEFWQGIVNMYTLQNITVWDYVLFYVIFLIVGPVHELAHGLTTKAYGGEVHEIGGMIMYFKPALYCNTNDAWTFQRRDHRLWVTFAGPWIDMVLAAGAAIVWVLVDPGTFIHKVAFFTALSAGLLGVLTNLNPLIPLDGYYALSDYLEVPNLRRRSFAYWGWLGKRYLLGMDVVEPTVTPRERKILLIYGGGAIAYSGFVLTVSLLWLILIFGRFLGPWVWVLVGFTVFGMLRKAAGRGRALAAAAATSWRAGFLSGSRAGIFVAGVVLIVGLPFITPWTFRAVGEFEIEAAPRAQVRAQVNGVLDRWHALEGDTVAAGAPIATLWNAELEAALLATRARADRLALTSAAADTRGDLAAAAAAAAALAEVQQQLAVLEARHRRLTIEAPIAGVILGYRLQERVGAAVAEGDMLVRVASLEGRQARVRLPIKQAGEVDAGQRATLKLSARPDLKFISSVAAVAPAAQAGWLEAEVAISTDDWQPNPGMTGVAKIAWRRGTLAQAIAHKFRQTIRLDLLL